MVIPCPIKIDCPGSDFPITNYSAEGPEQQPTFVSLYFPESWDRFGCLSLCYSEISQNDADLCALAQEAACLETPPPDAVFYSTAQTCSCTFSNGAEFFYTTPSGTFSGPTQEIADALAKSYACEHCGHSNPSNTQLGALDACACLGAAYSDTINFTGSAPLAWLVISGELPDGLSLNSITGRVSGTPTVNGTFTFTVRTFSTGGVNYGQKTYSISILEITTTTINAYTLGNAYSFQMQAAGGSGNYAWRINSGALPEGLSMSLSGLISGTPTSAGTNPLTFQVIDTDCEATNSTFFTPSIAITTAATTSIRTRRGFPDFSTGNTLYKRATYSGYMTQIAHTGDTVLAGTQCAGAKYTYAGWDEIDTLGNIIHRHTKILTEMCTNEDPTVLLLVAQPDGSNLLITYLTMPILFGYCWAADPSSCSTCETDENLWSPNGNWEKFGAQDFPYGMLTGPFYTTAATSKSYSGSLFQDNLVLFPEKTNFPKTSRGEDQYDLFVATSTGAWSVTLSDEFTDADAVAAQISYPSNSKSSENKPNTLTWVSNSITNIQSRYTTVNFSLNCTNLVDGGSYDVQYQLADSNGTYTAVLVSFSAVGTSHVITGTVPTPASGHTITIRNVKISFA